jgi:RNA cap guanine-N2 methyltransferase
MAETDRRPAEILPDTIEQLPVGHTWHVQEPFLIVTHQANDIGLVGWNDVRWKHQDKTIPPQQDLAKHTWQQAFDPGSQRHYFYNVAIGATAWDEPSSGSVPDDTVAYYLAAGLAEQCPPSAAADVRQPQRPPPSAANCKLRVIGSAAEDSADDGSSQSSDDAAAVSLTPAMARFNPRAKGDLEPQVERYWIARYSLTSRWAHGACFDERSLYSITPEVLAQHHADTLRGKTVLDAFCGCGGNTVQFARVADRVRVQNHLCLPRTWRTAVLIPQSRPEFTILLLG